MWRLDRSAGARRPPLALDAPARHRTGLNHWFAEFGTDGNPPSPMQVTTPTVTVYANGPPSGPASIVFAGSPLAGPSSVTRNLDGNLVVSNNGAKGGQIVTGGDGGNFRPAVDLFHRRQRRYGRGAGAVSCARQRRARASSLGSSRSQPPSYATATLRLLIGGSESNRHSHFSPPSRPTQSWPVVVPR